MSDIDPWETKRGEEIERLCALAVHAHNLWPYIDRRLLLSPYGTDAYDALGRALAWHAENEEVSS